MDMYIKGCRGWRRKHINHQCGNQMLAQLIAQPTGVGFGVGAGVLVWHSCQHGIVLCRSGVMQCLMPGHAMSLRKRVFVARGPILHAQSDHLDHSVVRHVTHESGLQPRLFCSWSGHWRPPFSAYWITLRTCFCVPPSHVTLHSDQSVQSDTSQFTTWYPT